MMKQPKEGNERCKDDYTNNLLLAINLVEQPDRHSLKLLGRKAEVHCLDVLTEAIPWG